MSDQTTEYPLHSERGIPLSCRGPGQRAAICVELYEKWYDLYVVTLNDARSGVDARIGNLYFVAGSN